VNLINFELIINY